VFSRRRSAAWNSVKQRRNLHLSGEDPDKIVRRPVSRLLVPTQVRGVPLGQEAPEPTRVVGTVRQGAHRSVEKDGCLFNQEMVEESVRSYER